MLLDHAKDIQLASIHIPEISGIETAFDFPWPETRISFRRAVKLKRFGMNSIHLFRLFNHQGYHGTVSHCSGILLQGKRLQDYLEKIPV